VARRFASLALLGSLSGLCFVYCLSGTCPLRLS
jgi:hypothetical protein